MRSTDMSYSSQSAEQTHAWIARQLPGRPHPSVKRPINWVRIIAVTTTILGTITFFAVAWPYLIPILQSRNVWAAISLIAILLFTSGHMFNHIRKVPYVAGDGKGGVSYFAGGFQSQYGLETQIIAAMCKLYRLVSIQLLTVYRWTVVICNYLVGSESTKNSGSQDSTACCDYLGRCDLCHVQLLTECLQNQEWRLPILAATILLVACVDVKPRPKRAKHGMDRTSYDHGVLRSLERHFFQQA